MNGVGYTFWLIKLSALIPMAETGVGSENAITLLVVKMCMDSYIWGTFSNTMGLAGRRMILEVRIPKLFQRILAAMRFPCRRALSR
jgi:hypothetical protein